MSTAHVELVNCTYVTSTACRLTITNKLNLGNNDLCAARPHDWLVCRSRGGVLRGHVALCCMGAGNSRWVVVLPAHRAGQQELLYGPESGDSCLFLTLLVKQLSPSPVTGAGIGPQKNNDVVTRYFSTI